MTPKKSEIGETLSNVAEWKTHFRQNREGEADCGIFYESFVGHAFAVARCPRYMREAEWVETSNRMIICTKACAGVKDPEDAIKAARNACRSVINGWSNAKDLAEEALALLTPAQ